MDSSPVSSGSPSSSVFSSDMPSAPHSSDHDQQPNVLTVTQLEQLRVEEKVADIYRILNGASPHTKTIMMELWRDKHILFLSRGLNQLGPNFRILDASRPWLCYWIIHSMSLLGESLDIEVENSIIEFLSHCEDEQGGYGGGPGQMPHLATTYAAVNTLVTLGSDEALSSVNRDSLHKFLLRMKDSSGAFRMHHAGEIDVRACYTAISPWKAFNPGTVVQDAIDELGGHSPWVSWQLNQHWVASILNIMDFELVCGLGDYIIRCQTYEGGIAGEPGSEAHGGYTFCGLATMVLIDEVDRLHLPSLIDWVVFRQGVECGFQGRTNKLVDGCYSFWQGGSLSLVQTLLPIAEKQTQSPRRSIEHQTLEGNSDGSTSQVHNPENEDTGTQKGGDNGFHFIRMGTRLAAPLFHTVALQQYILLCSQVLEGGFKDKPGAQRDYYHTCYCLSGLCVSQYSFSKAPNSPPPSRAMLGPYSNLLEPIHPLYNVLLDKYYRAHEFFSGMK